MLFLVVAVSLFIIHFLVELICGYCDQPQQITKDSFKRMADEYSEFGNFTTLEGGRTADVDYLIDHWLLLEEQPDRGVAPNVPAVPQQDHQHVQ